MELFIPARKPNKSNVAITHIVSFSGDQKFYKYCVIKIISTTRDKGCAKALVITPAHYTLSQLYRVVTNRKLWKRLTEDIGNTGANNRRWPKHSADGAANPSADHHDSNNRHLDSPQHSPKPTVRHDHNTQGA